MLIRFNVKNFLSFYQREDGRSHEFSMLAGKTQRFKTRVEEDGKSKLLKYAAVFGANASGKSNFVKALAFMQKTVQHGLQETCLNKYCKTDANHEKQASYFELEIKLNDHYYAYGFEVLLSKMSFVSEWLYELSPSGKDKLIFARDLEKGKMVYGDRIQTSRKFSRLKIYGEDVQNDDSVLLLKVMNQNKKDFYQKKDQMQVFQEVYNWITNTLKITFATDSVSGYSYFAKNENYDVIANKIAMFDTGIVACKLVEIPFDVVKQQLPYALKSQLNQDLASHRFEMEENHVDQSVVSIKTDTDFFVIGLRKEKEGIQTYAQKLVFQHQDSNYEFDLSEESDGTKRLLDLLEVLLTEEEKVYVIDELDRCLHPCLSYEYVEQFLERAEKCSVQLITTTHESRLLDFDLLRRDEIWLVEKDAYGQSHMYSLDEYQIRFDQKVDKAYLEGRYGGVPIFHEPIH